MTDIELKRREAICNVAGIKDIGDLSDGFHTFNSLYEQRMILFAALVKAYKDKSWKSYRHEDGKYCFGGGWFIVGIDTPEGSYTYHYENKYWDMFDCVDLPRSPHWDGHTEADAETRIMSLEPERGGMITLGQILDLIDIKRESKEVINIVNFRDFSNIKAMVCSEFWEGLEDTPVRRIRAEGSELYIWLEELNDDD